MLKHFLIKASATASALALAGILGTGCSDLPGSPGQQGAAVGGLGGAAVGAAVAGEDHRLLGALLGGALGAGGGYLIGANSDRITGKDTTGARRAQQRAQTNPATADQARKATSADLNSDGFVTMDEIIAMGKAGWSDTEIVERLRATGQVFELTPSQQEHLRNQGVSQQVLNQLPELNREVRDRLMRDTSVIGRTPKE